MSSKTDSESAKTLVPPAPHRSRRAVYLTATLVVLLSSIPYFYGLSQVGSSPSKVWYSGFNANVSDSYVYMAWITRASEGHFFEYNLFTTDTQYGKKFNVFFFALGMIARWTHLAPPVVYHCMRVVLGIALLRAVWWLLELLMTDNRTRWAAFLTIAFSSGLGWVIEVFSLRHWLASWMLPTDLWMPESITFLCLYSNALFLVSLLLMVGVIGFLVTAEQKQTWRHAVWAGLCALALGNIHTYDIIALATTWGCFLLARPLIRRQFTRDDLRSLARGAIVGGMAAVSGGYQYYVLLTDPVFAARVDVATLSPRLYAYLLGYGLTAVLSITAIALSLRWCLARRDRRVPSSAKQARAGRGVASAPLEEYLGIRNEGALLLSVWLVANFAVAYLPVPFQRKLLMGTHIPMAALAGVTIAYCLRDLSSRAWVVAVVCIMLILMPSNVVVLFGDMRDINKNATADNTVRLFLYSGEVQALQWIRDNVPRDVPVQPLPWVELGNFPPPPIPVDERGRSLWAPLLLTDSAGVKQSYGVFDTSVACFAPCISGHMVNVGHIGESTNYFEHITEWAFFLLPMASDPQRIDLLRKSGVRYLLFSQKHDETGQPFLENNLLGSMRTNPPPYLQLVPEASNSDADVYRVVLPDLPAESSSTNAMP